MAEPGEDRDSGIEFRPCTKCKCPLAIVIGPNGKKIPLDIRTPCYTLGKDLAGNPVAEPAKDAHPTHFATCSHSSEFSKAKPRR